MFRGIESAPSASKPIPFSSPFRIWYPPLYLQKSGAFQITSSTPSGVMKTRLGTPES